MVRYRIGVLFLLLTAACGSIKTAIPTATALPTKPTNPTAVARVYNTEISIGDFQIMVRFIRFQLIYQYNHFERLARLNSSVPKTRDYYLSQSKDIANQLTDYQGIGGEALSHMVNDKLIRQEAQKRDITVNPEEIDSRLREFFNLLSGRDTHPYRNARADCDTLHGASLCQRPGGLPQRLEKPSRCQ